MKILGIVGSPRAGNTQFLVEEALKEIQKSGFETEIILLKDLQIASCLGCGHCEEKGECSQKDDMAIVIEKMASSDGIIIGSPVYFCGVSSQTKAMMDRTCCIRDSFVLQNKVGGGISVGAYRNGGQETTLQQIHAFFLTHNAVVVSEKESSHFGGVGVGCDVNDAKKDEFGIETSKNLARKVCEVVKMIKRR